MKHVSMGLTEAGGSSLQSEASEDGAGVLANNTLVAANLDLVGGLSDWTSNNNDLSIAAGNSGGELGVGGDRNGGSARSTGGATVLAGVTSCSLRAH